MLIAQIRDDTESNPYHDLASVPSFNLLPNLTADLALTYLWDFAPSVLFVLSDSRDSW